MSAVGNLNAAALGKTINVETENTLKVFQNYFGPYPYHQIAVTNIVGTYGQGWPGLLYLSWLMFLDSTQRHALGIKNQTQLTDFFRGHESSHQWWGSGLAGRVTTISGSPKASRNFPACCTCNSAKI
jgi:hypothetical protein